MKKYIIILAILLLSGSVFAQDTPLNYVIRRDGALTYIGTERDINMTDGTGYYLTIGWNPSGTYFLTIFLESGNNIILINDLTVPEAFTPFTEIDVYSGRLFDFNDESLLFTELIQDMLVSEDEQGLAIMRMNVYDWAIDEGQSAISAIGSIPFGVGCGGGNIANALDTAYNEEAHGDTTGQYNRVILEQTPYGIVHSNSCTAIRSYLTQPDTMESVELFENLRWVSVSPDGEFAIGTFENTLKMIELKNTVEISNIAVANAPIVSTVWSADSQYIYYATRHIVIGESLDIDDPDGILEINDPFSNAPQSDDTHVWQSTLYQYELSSATSTEIYSAEAYAISNLTIVDDALFFSQIETPRAWLQAYVDDPATATPDLIERSYWLYNFVEEELIQLDADFAGAFIQP